MRPNLCIGTAAANGSFFQAYGWNSRPSAVTPVMVTLSVPPHNAYKTSNGQ